MSVRFERLHDLDLVFGIDPRKDRNVLDDLLQILNAHLGQLSAGDDTLLGIVRIQDAEITRNVQGSKGMISCDHHRPNAGRFADSNSLAHFGPRRVDHAGHTHKDHPLLKQLFSDLAGQRFQGPHGDAEYPHAFIRQAVVGTRDAPGPSFIQWLHLAIVPNSIAGVHELSN